MASNTWSEAASPAITNIELFPVRYPTVMRFKFFEGPSSGAGRPAILIKITAEDGSVGWGESVPVARWSYETLEGAVAALEKYIKPVLIGLPSQDIAGAHAAMDREIAGSFSTGYPITKAGVDLALHDLVARQWNMNVAQLLWPKRAMPESILLSWTLNPTTLDEVPALIEKGRERGYENFNVKVAPDLKADLALCKLVKELVPDGFLWADANGGYDRRMALKAARAFADLGMPVLEQPLKTNELSGYQELTKLGALPIVMDEGIVSVTELREFMRLGMLDGLAMKPARCGGLTSANAQCALIDQYNMMLLGSGLTDPDVSLAASLLLYGAYSIRFPCALNGPQFLGESVLKEPLVVAGGRIKVPTGPGLGVEVDEDKVRDLMARTWG